MIILLGQDGADQPGDAALVGEMPTTSARRLTSLFSRSNGLVLGGARSPQRSATSVPLRCRCRLPGDPPVERGELAVDAGLDKTLHLVPSTQPAPPIDPRQFAFACSNRRAGPTWRGCYGPPAGGFPGRHFEHVAPKFCRRAGDPPLVFVAERVLDHHDGTSWDLLAPARRAPFGLAMASASRPLPPLAARAQRFIAVAASAALLWSAAVLSQSCRMEFSGLLGNPRKPAVSSVTPCDTKGPLWERPFLLSS